MAAPRISIIVPCCKDRALVMEKMPLWRGYPHAGEVIVSAVATDDPAQDSAWESQLAQLGASVVWSPEPNRGRQMNAGAAAAAGDVLLFHHADSILEPGHLFALQLCMGDERAIGGAYYRAFDERHARLRRIQILERVRCWVGGPLFGDQSIFVRRRVFEHLGGFADIPLMEDLEFSKRLRRAGRVLLLDPPMYSSPRMTYIHGSWRTSLRNAVMILLFELGYCPSKLHAWYYRLQV